MALESLRLNPLVRLRWGVFGPLVWRPGTHLRYSLHVGSRWDGCVCADIRLAESISSAYTYMRFPLLEGHRETPRPSLRHAAIPPLRTRAELPHGRSSVGFGLAHPYEFAKSKNRRRSDVSRLLRRAWSDIELSPNDAKVSRNDIEKAHSVDFRSLSVAK